MYTASMYVSNIEDNGKDSVAGQSIVQQTKDQIRHSSVVNA